MNEPAPPMPASYMAVWIGVMIALSLAQQYQGGGAEAFADVGYSVGRLIPFSVVGWVLAKVSWPSYWRQKYRRK